MKNLINKIHCGDCLDFMAKLPDKCVNLICIDPPYNIKKAEWDDIPDYVNWLGRAFLECQRVLKDNGSFYFFHNDFLQIVELQNWINKNTNFIFKQFITWSKIHEDFNNLGFVQQRLSIDMQRNYYNGFTEYCLYYTFQDETGLTKIMSLCFEKYLKYMTDEKIKLCWDNNKINNFLGYSAIASHWFYNNKKMQLQPRFISEKDYKKLQTTGYFQKEYEDLRKEYESERYDFNVTDTRDNLRANSNVWAYEPAKQQGHITPKPVDLIMNIIEHSSNAGDIVLDCFAGSGSTLVAAECLGRNWIGCEISEKYCEIARTRIHNERNGRLFDPRKELENETPD